ncbi:MAG: hypothetical protein ACJARX_002439 [Psychroserpens sp.]|jgi:hypothetical protein|uniref:hypothetical protein n=1 Tax=Psychroserpens sp. TaxID=2020870 RepID=UPI0039E5F1E4
MSKNLKRVDNQLFKLNIIAKVSVTNITVNVNELQTAYTNCGLGSIPAGTTVSGAVAAIDAKLKKRYIF